VSIDTSIALGGLILNFLTALAAVYIAFLALVHTAKPRINVVLLEGTTQPCNRLIKLRFELQNVGYWYALPPAIEITTYCNFDPAFDLIGLGYGSQQEIRTAEVRIGKGSRKYLKAQGIKLIANDFGEIVQVHLKTPQNPGRYLARLSAYSANGLSHVQDFYIECIDHP